MMNRDRSCRRKRGINRKRVEKRGYRWPMHLKMYMVSTNALRYQKKS